MSQENVEIVRRAYEAATRRPKPDFAAVNALYHPDHEFVSLASRVEGRSFVGAEGFREVLQSYADTFESWDAKIEEIRGIDAERVLVVADVNAIGRRGGVHVEQRFVYVLTVQDGKVVRTELYSSPEDALEAVGLSE
jgi:ketosteroid isomerase-like protein